MAGFQIDPEPLLPSEYKDLPISALRLTARTKIGRHLDLEGTIVICVDDEGHEIDVSTNYNGLAELAGFDYTDIRNMGRHRYPTQELLDQWTSRDGYNNNAKVGYLWKYLRLMDREDVLKDCHRVILADCKHFVESEQRNQDVDRSKLEEEPIQDPEVDSKDDMEVDETDIVAVQDVPYALAGDTRRIQFDAFVCYSFEDPMDRQFVRYLIEIIELQERLKLFVPGRDDMPGGAQNTINAFIIEKRCKRVVIVLSRAFLKSPVCDFQLKYAQRLSEAASSKKLIPVIRDEETHIPRILQHIEPCDLTKADMVDWVWKRLIAAIRAPTGPMVEDSSIELEQSLKEVRFPTQQRRLKSDSGTTSGSRKTGRSRRQTEPLSITGISNDSSSGTIPCPTETLSKRRISSFGGRTSKDSYVPVANCSSTSPAVSNLPRPPASPSIPINVKQNQQVIEALPNINSTESVVPEPTAPDLV